MVGKVFVNYRREDTKGEAQALRTYLEPRLSRCEILMDVDGGIRPGTNFVRVIEERIKDADIVVCIIGPKWLSVTDANGGRRLDGPEDFVKIEIAAALKRDIPIIPILIDDARMPAEADLPDEIRMIAFKQATRLRDDRFKADADIIAQRLKELLGEKIAARAPRWLVAASLVAALGIGTTAGPAGVRLAGMDGYLPFAGDSGQGRNRAQALEAEIKKLEVALGTAMTRQQALIVEVKDKDSTLASMSSSFSGEQTKTKRLEGELVVSTSNVKKLEEQIATLEAEKSSAFDKGVSRAQTAASRKYARELKIELKKVKDSAEKELNKQKATANEALARANDENARRQKDIDGLKSELQKRSVEARELRRELDTLKLKKNTKAPNKENNKSKAPSIGDDAVAEAKKASTMATGSLPVQSSQPSAPVNRANK